jgi:MoaA/NifB/PqqE/SkfB family radical SAM enzyme
MNNLQKIIDKKTYRKFKGADWPTYESFINNNYTVEENIQKELDDFVVSMNTMYEELTKSNTEELSSANQKRQKQIFFNKNYSKSICNYPWNHLGINANGNIFICESPSWIPIFVGNILESDNIYDILNNEKSKKIRQEILEHRYYYCNSSLCNFFKDKDIANNYNENIQDADLLPLNFVDNDNLYVRQIPTILTFDFDYTCNYKCPSCRTEYKNFNNHHVIRPVNNRISQKIKDLIIDKIQDQYIEIRWCGGELFMSETYLDLLEYIVGKNKQNIEHCIQTNGSLLKAKAGVLKKMLPFVSVLRISFDAATEETYKKTRVGGNWENLIENVKFTMDLIKENNFKTTVKADFVIQFDNYKEIPQFVKLCHSLGIKSYNLQKMWNWGTWDTKTFQQKNVYDKSHLLYPDVKKYLKIINHSDNSS